ncbi:SDR family NAD(P)-dependent oxidoreductase [Lysobacter sp. H21R4]|uniref:SDR family NAD(P)-dependent oxidoreductase n=1 Tax=Lysobacter sp. H21R4 TaxID=2781021 RepID=UPI001886C324|nr:SDR family NAD(P)-dependent oxidoreductase [Lysobacter sp. H21R4]QOY61903.1 SDR family NAD(P)-dependent oxidoreductase [Lysobacter sp. H21R4]
MQSVAGKIVLVTGAAMGMGRLYAERAIAEGARSVVLWDLDGPALAATRDEIGRAGTQVHAHVVDVASLSDITTAAERVRSEVGDPDVVINNAGIVRSKLFWEHDHSHDIAAVMDINVLALMHIAREFLPAMIANPGPARLLNVASASGMLSVPRMSVYAASKWAVIGWSDSLRLELLRAGHGHVRVTTLIPSYITTGMFAGARPPLLTPLMAPEDVVDRAWRAMKRGKPRLMMPWSVWLSGALRGVLPLPLWDVLADRVFRVYSSMDHFTGRGPKPGA